MKQKQTIFLIIILSFSSLASGSFTKMTKGSFCKRGVLMALGAVAAAVSFVGLEHYWQVSSLEPIEVPSFDERGRNTSSVLQRKEGLYSCPFSAGRTFLTLNKEALGGHLKAMGNEGGTITQETAQGYCNGLLRTQKECDNLLLGTLKPSGVLIDFNFKGEVTIEKANRIIHPSHSAATQRNGSFDPSAWKNLGDEVFHEKVFLGKKEFLKRVTDANEDKGLEEASSLFKFAHRRGLTKESLNKGEFNAYVELYGYTQEPGGELGLSREIFDDFEQFADLTARQMNSGLNPSVYSLHGQRQMLEGSFFKRAGKVFFRLNHEAQVLKSNESKLFHAFSNQDLEVKHFPENITLGEPCYIIASLEADHSLFIKEVYGFVKEDIEVSFSKNYLAKMAWDKRQAEIKS